MEHGAASPVPIMRPVLDRPRRPASRHAAILIFAAALFAMAPPGAPILAAETPAVASTTKYELIGTYDLARLDSIFGDELDDFMQSSPEPHAFDGRFPPARYPVRLYKVTYASVVPELDNLPTVASGLVAVPETGLSSMPMVSYQHGTVFDRNAVPSRPDQSMETRIMIARFAAQGYVVIGADYFGRGDSDLPDFDPGEGERAAGQPRHARRGEIGLAALGITPSHTFLSGWSQGGWGTMVFLERLEGLGVPVTAAAVASAPVDVALGVNRWLNNPQPIDAVYLPGVLALQLEADAFYHQAPGIDAVAIRPNISRRHEIFTPAASISRPSMPRPRIACGLHDAGVQGGAFRQAREPYWQRLDERQGYRWKQVHAAQDLVWRLR